MENTPRYDAPAPSNRYRIEAVHEAGLILKLLGNSREPLGSEEIATRLTLTPNKAFRMCATLEELGFLEEAGGKYTIGLGLALIWAKKKAQLETTVKKTTQDLATLNGRPLTKEGRNEILDAALDCTEEAIEKGEKADEN